MTLRPGERLGAYEVLGALGAGAMGEVYRARDSRLGREVALKALPVEFAGNAGRRRRFQQESRAAGMLNHPNIVAVYDVGEYDGVPYIVSELVEGESLRCTLQKGRMPLRRALEIAAEISDGLTAAHEAGIIHRDLKPENIMISRDGRAKILDFGLARCESAKDAVEGQTLTEPGQILGTTGYMSPEQVAGATADSRSDIFALGIILFEMLTGRLAFARTTSVETMTAILREDTPELPGEVPAPVRLVVAHCLEKDCSRRFQSAQDLAFHLRAIGATAGSEGEVGGRTTPPQASISAGMSSTPPARPSLRTGSGIRHELRNALNQVVGYAEMVKELAEDSCTELSRGLDSLCQDARETLSNLAVAPVDDPAEAARLRDRLFELRERLEGRIAALRPMVRAVERADVDADFARLCAALEGISRIAGELGPSESKGLRPGSSSDAGRRSAGSAGSRGRVLVVDDSSENRDLLSRRLEHLGCTVAQASGGRAALELALKEPFDLVLLDMMMPDLDGVEVLKRMKDDVTLREVPVIVVSAVDDVSNVAHCIEMGAEDYLSKPFNALLLRARVTALLERKRLRQSERRRTEQLEQARREIEQQAQVAQGMLLNILPASIADELRAKGRVEPVYFQDVTIVFTDFVGFTSSTQQMAAEDLVAILHQYFSSFDEITDAYGLEKLKTIGDSYMFAGGMPGPNSSHPVDAILAAFEMLEVVAQMASARPDVGWRIRVGMHTGPVVAGVVGIRKFAYDIWGESVNVSKRMESAGEPNRINLSQATWCRIKDFFECESRGRIMTKEAQEVEMYFAKAPQRALIRDTTAVPPPAFARRYQTYFHHELRRFPQNLISQT